MQVTTARGIEKHRILIIAVMWLLAGVFAFMAAGQSSRTMFLPPEYQLRLSAVAVQQFAAAFPLLAGTVALSLLCVWFLECERDGAFLVCTGMMVLEGGYQYAQRSDVSSWLIPMIPEFFRHVWPLDQVQNYMGRGTFDINNVAAIVLGAIFSYVVVLNSIPKSRRA